MSHYVTIPEIVGANKDDMVSIITNRGNNCNEEYVTTLCVGCGMFFGNIDGNYRTAKIVDQCRMCFNK